MDLHQATRPAPPPGRPRYHNVSDRAFLLAISGVVRAHLDDPSFGTVDAATELSISRMHLHRKLRTLIGCSTRQYITSRRLEEACEMLGHQELTVREVSRRVGFRSASYFARAFVRAYGVYPSVFVRERRGDGGPPGISAPLTPRPIPDRFPRFREAAAAPLR